MAALSGGAHMIGIYANLDIGNQSRDGLGMKRSRETDRTEIWSVQVCLL